MFEIRWRLAAVLPAAVLAFAARAAAGDADIAVFDRVWQTVKDRFYDHDLHGVDWDAMRDHYRPLYLATTTPDESRDVVRKLLSELKASHTSVLEKPVYDSMMAELQNERTPTFGVLLEESLPGRLFVRAMFEGGPAERAGLRLGDRVVGAGGVDVFAHPLVVDAGYDPGLPGPRLFSIAAKAAGSAIVLRVQSEPTGADLRDVRLRAEAMNGVDAAQRSARVVEQGGVRIGIMHIWYCQDGAADALRAALAGPLAECDALVLDLRGRGGMTDVAASLLDVFRGKSKSAFGGKRGAPLWTKPVVALIDQRTRSAKELMAFRLRKNRLATLVGERTEGAVLGAGFYALPDGSTLELASIDVPIDGERLEGVGVEPHVAVDFPVAYVRGRDAILERGIAVAVEQITMRKRDRAPARGKGPL